MNDENQLPVPPSFMSLFVEPGRIRPNASHAHIAARYDLCEDLANLLTDQARNVMFDLGIAEGDVLERIHAGLGGVLRAAEPSPPLPTPSADAAADPAAVTPAEARWVVTRLAELLGWPPLHDPTHLPDRHHRPR